jgi:GTP-binding protein
MNESIRNIGIIAHVDHGKTTLVDKLLREGGVYRENQVAEERAMDSMDLEREKGITIRAKNASVHWKGTTINIVDTPGHADFGGEVERILKMVDGVLVLVDAFDGPQAQTRFVLRKALQNNLQPIVVVNKIDRENADPHRVHDEVLELLLELHANEHQFNAPFLYASARDGYAIRNIGDERSGMTPLFETILQTIPPPEADADAPFQMLVSNLDWSDYVGRIAIGKITGGQVQVGDSIVRIQKDGRRQRAAVTKVFEFSGLGSSESVVGKAGNIIGIAGFGELDIGETLCDSEEREPLPFVEIDPPTIQKQFCVNDGPLAGRDGKYLTSRHLRERLPRPRARRTAERHSRRTDAARGVRNARFAARSDP